MMPSTHVQVAVERCRLEQVVWTLVPFCLVRETFPELGEVAMILVGHMKWNSIVRLAETAGKVPCQMVTTTIGKCCYPW